VQPWHWQATHMSMVVVATQLISPNETFSLMRVIYENQNSFSDQVWMFGNVGGAFCFHQRMMGF
jgi:hypothetical protein